MHQNREKKLSSEAQWDGIHDYEQISQKHHSFKDKCKKILRRLLGRKTFDFFRNYADYLFWHSILPSCLPPRIPGRVLEVGSAPGKFLIDFRRQFGSQPYGIEYSTVGVETNRGLFEKNDINPNQVVHADFLSEDFHDLYRRYFDIVISRGFIEHFQDVNKIIDLHLNLLSEGGYLIISIPNLKGINYTLARLTNRSLISIHNLDIMSLDNFSELFAQSNLKRIYCDYYGTINLHLFHSGKSFLSNLFTRGLHLLQPVLNFMMRLLFGRKGLESGKWSPYLMYIGKKIGPLEKTNY